MKSGKRLFMLALAAIMALGLSACGQEEIPDLSADSIKETTIYIRNDGSIDVAYVEDFAKSYYSKAGLSDFATALSAEYNKAKGSKIGVTGVEVTGGKAILIMNFDDPAVFTDFDEGDTLKVAAFSENDAHAEFDDLRFDQTGRMTKSGSLTFGSEIIGKNQAYAEIDGRAVVQVESKILYYAGGELIDEHHIRSFDDEKTVIIYKK